MSSARMPSVGRFRLRSRLGLGGMGEVYLALVSGPHGVEEPVALKLIRRFAHRTPGTSWRWMDSHSLVEGDAWGVL